MPHCHHNKIKTAKQGLQGHPWSDPCLPVQRHHSPLSHPSDHSGLVSVPVMCPACCCLWAFIFSVPSAWGALPQLLTWLALSYPSDPSLASPSGRGLPWFFYCQMWPFWTLHDPGISSSVFLGKSVSICLYLWLFLNMHGGELECKLHEGRCLPWLAPCS